jgi:hypothetical protein
LEKNLKDEKLQILLEKIAEYLERMKIREYIELIQNPKRIIYLNLLGGIFRGFGMAIGMTFLFAILVYILHKLSALPVIGNYIAEIVKIVKEELKNK